MHIKLTSLTLIILSLLLLVSCAKTPEHDVVAEKDNQVLEDRIESSEGENAPLEENVFETFQNSDNTITFDFDSADIVIPDIQSYPVYCVAPHFWSSEEIEQVCSVALQGADVYEYTDKMTKSQIEERILELRKMLDPESMYEYYQGDEITIEEVKADAERQLSALEEAYEDADDTAEPVLSDFQYRADNEWHEETSYLYTEDSEGVDSVRATVSVNGVPYWIYVIKQVSGTYLDSTCVPYYNNMPLLNVGGSTMYTESYRPNIYSTEMTISASRGTIMSMDLISPLDTEEADTAVLLSEEDAIEKIKEQLTYKFTTKLIAQELFGDFGIEDITSATVNVYKIRLGYVRVNVRDNEHEYLLIPAWIVYGSYLEGNNSDYPEPTLDENGDPYMEPLLVVNAMDGSVIDLEQGY